MSCRDAPRCRPRATSPTRSAPYAQAPRVTDDVLRVTRDAVAGAGTPYEQAVALQEFFRDPDNGFSYDERDPEPFDNPDALGAFLDSRVGFCEQYASAMAAMLRVLDVPARVAVGFTPGTAQSDDTYVVSTDDAHAWPEAWFEGSGWVRFEPTPVSDDREIVPTYTEEADAPLPGSTPSTGASAAPVPSASASTDAGKDLDRALGDGAETPLADPSGGAGGGGLPSTRTLLLTLVAVLAVAPAVVALLRRRARWRSPDALTAWAQLQDDAADVGHRWRAAESPRAAAVRLAAERRLPEDAVAALQRLVDGAEQARYARPGTDARGPVAGGRAHRPGRPAPRGVARDAGTRGAGSAVDAAVDRQPHRGPAGGRPRPVRRRSERGDAPAPAAAAQRLSGRLRGRRRAVCTVPDRRTGRGLGELRGGRTRWSGAPRRTCPGRGLPLHPACAAGEAARRAHPV